MFLRTRMFSVAALFILGASSSIAKADTLTYDGMSNSQTYQYDLTAYYADSGFTLQGATLYLTDFSSFTITGLAGVTAAT